jgi:hypothetical protein
MKKMLLSLIAGLTFVSTSAFAETLVTADGFDLWVSGGYIEGDVNFQINDPTFTISTLNFEIDGAYLALGGRYQFLPTFFPQISLYFDWKSSRHVDGTLSDTDILTLANPNAIWIHSDSDVNGDWDQLDINFGYEIVNLKDGKVSAEFLVGYQKHEYDFSIHNTATDIFDFQSVYSIAFGETASYRANIEGPYLGLSGKAWINSHFALNASVKYLIDPEADARGVWQLRDLFFSESGQGHGYEASVGATYVPKENWYVSVQGFTNNLEIDDGNDDFYVNSGTQRYLGSTPLDYIEFDSNSVEARVGYLF